MRAFHLTTECRSDGIYCMWPNGELAGIIEPRHIGDITMWHVKPAETGMPDWTFHNRQASEYYMLAAAYEYVDNTGEFHKLEKAA